jgi:hypothetical protein
MGPAPCGDAPPPRDAVLTENDDDFLPMRARTLATRDWKITLYAGSEEGELHDRRNAVAKCVPVKSPLT